MNRVVLSTMHHRFHGKDMPYRKTLLKGYMVRVKVEYNFNALSKSRIFL